MKLAKILFSFLAIAALVTFIIRIVIGRGAELGLLVAAALAALAGRFDDVRKFKLSSDGLEAELDELVSEAKVTLEQLQSLALVQGRMLLEFNQAEGRFGGGLPLKNRNTHRKDLLEELNKLGLDPEKINNMMQIEHQYMESDYKQVLLRQLDIERSPDQNEKWSALMNPYKKQRLPPEKIERALVLIDQVMEGEVFELFLDYKQFYQDRSHRRPEKSPAIGAE